MLALRADPTLAPAVLDLLAGRAEPVLALVRGDAQRIVGREAEAMRDHAAAVAAIEPRSGSSRPRRDGPSDDGTTDAGEPTPRSRELCRPRPTRPAAADSEPSAPANAPADAGTVHSSIPA